MAEQTILRLKSGRFGLDCDAIVRRCRVVGARHELGLEVCTIPGKQPPLAHLCDRLRDFGIELPEEVAATPVLA